MDNTKNIEHLGVVEEVNHDELKISFMSQAACGECQAKSLCGTSNEKNKVINIKDFSGNYTTGEKVKVILKQSLGYKAVLISYVIPFVMVLVLLISLNAFGVKELVSGIFTLVMLVPYYFILFLFKKKIEKTYSFTIKKFD